MQQAEHSLLIAWREATQQLSLAVEKGVRSWAMGMDDFVTRKKSEGLTTAFGQRSLADCPHQLMPPAQCAGQHQQPLLWHQASAGHYDRLLATTAAKYNQQYKSANTTLLIDETPTLLHLLRRQKLPLPVAARAATPAEWCRSCG